MNLTALRAEVAECRAWERSLLTGSRSMRKSSAVPGRADWILPLFMPLSSFAAGDSWMVENREWFLLGPWWWVFLFSKGISARTVPDEWEALRMPSRRAWLLSRWTFRVLPLLWLGACTACWLALRPPSEGPSLRPTGVIGVLLWPLLASAFGSWIGLQNERFHRVGIVAPLFAALLTAGTVAAAVWCLVSTGPNHGILAAATGVLALVLGLLSAPSVLILLRAANRDNLARGLPRIFRVLVVGGFAATALVLEGGFAFFADGFLPAGVPVDAGASVLAVFVAAALAVVVLDALTLPDRVDIGIEWPPEPDAFAPAKSVSVPAGGAGGTVSRRKGLFAASWALYRGRWRTLQHPWLLFLPKLLWECRAPVWGLLAALAMANLGFVGLLFSAIFLMAVANPLRLPESRRLHFLGVDYVSVARHNLVSGLLLAVLPAVAGASLPFLFEGMRHERIDLSGAVLFTAAYLVFRNSARGLWILDRVFPRPGVTIFRAVLLTVLLHGVFEGPKTLLIFGATLFVFATVVAAWDFFDPEGAGRRLEARAADD